MKQYKAFLFDLNGTLINDMQYHIIAWHKILNSLGVNISLEETKEQCYGKNEELLERVLPGKFSADQKEKCLLKRKAISTNLSALFTINKRCRFFLEKAYEQNMQMAIGTAAIMFNVDFVLDGLQLHKYFKAIISADDVQLSKPHPETYLKCAEQLKVNPADCLVFEDSPKGMESAANAGMDCVALTTMHTKAEFAHLTNIVAVIEDYNDTQLKALF